MKRRRFRKLADGELSSPACRRKNNTYVAKLKCCDCGLVHLMQYTITKRGLRFRAWRLNHKRGLK